MRDRFEILIEGLEFDLWANRKWFAYLTEKGLGEPETKIFQHLLSGQEVWRLRCFGTPPDSMPMFEVTEDKIVELNQAWKSILEHREDDPLIHYHRFDGVAGHLRVSRIARHVIDHGTYHRGELRGLCRGRNAEDFPETGLAAYYMEMGLNT